MNIARGLAPMSGADHEPEKKSRRPDSRPTRTRAQFRAALIVLLDRQQFEQIRVRDIAAEAGSGTATFFRHYRDKGDLLEDVIREFLQTIRSPTAALLEASQGLMAAMAICDFLDKNRQISRILLTGGASAAVHQQFVKLAVELADGMSLERPSLLPGSLGRRYALHASINILSWWLSEMPDMPITQVAHLIDHLVLSPAITYRPNADNEPEPAAD